jgi:hypothetical protein
MSDVEIGVTNHEQAGTELVGDADDEGNFGNEYILQVLSPGVVTRPAVGRVDGLRAFASGVAVLGLSVQNDCVVGESEGEDKSGVVGIGDVGVRGEGVVAGVAGIGALATGVGVVGTGGGVGVQGTGKTGVIGASEGGDGVIGASDGTNGIGVVGSNGNNIGIFGDGQTAIFGLGRDVGVRGDGVVGVKGFAKPLEGGSGVGVTGFGGNGIGVHCSAGLKGIGVLAASSDPRLPGRHGTAGLFRGALIVSGGAKSAAVPHPDGSHRLLYSLESPESWFEDFGEGRLKGGKVKIKLDPDFAKVIKTDKYHVFLTSYGDSHGLYVTNRTNKGFEVREQQGGKSSLTFSYRVVAKRKDIEIKRLAKVTLPAVPSLAAEKRLAKVKLPKPRLVRPPATPKPRHVELPPTPKYPFPGGASG